MIHHGYYAIILNLPLLTFYGVKNALSCMKKTNETKKEHFKQIHRFRMVVLWLQAIYWIGRHQADLVVYVARGAWLVEHWFPPDWAVRIDRVVCQSVSHVSASDCWVAVSLNLNLTNAFITWRIWVSADGLWDLWRCLIFSIIFWPRCLHFYFTDFISFNWWHNEPRPGGYHFPVSYCCRNQRG